MARRKHHSKRNLHKIQLKLENSIFATFIRQRTKEEAIEMVQDFLKRIKDGESFSELAGKYSDCSSYKKGGDLGKFGRGQMQKVRNSHILVILSTIFYHFQPFEDASFALKVGELSDIVVSIFNNSNFTFYYNSYFSGH